MKFGVLLFRGIFGVQLLDGGLPELLRLTKIAEELDYDSAWYADEAWWSPDPIVYATLMARETSKIKIGTMGTNPYVRHPLSLALSFHTFGEIAGERAIVGIAAGSEARLKKLGLARLHPREAVRESIEIMRKLSNGRPLEYQGTTVKVTGVGKTWIKNDLKIHVCSNGPRMLELAGEIADGVALAHFPPSYTSWGLDYVKKGLAKSQKSISEFDYEVQPIVFVDEDRDKAFEIARKYLQFLPPPIALQKQQLLEKCGFSPGEAATVRKAFLEAFASPKIELPRDLADKIVRSFAITGTPEEAIAKIKDYEKSGISRIIVGFMPEQNIGERLRYFRERIIDSL